MRSLLNQMRNYGGPLTPECRARVARFLSNPCVETWEDAYTIIISDRFTLWSAWCAVDPTAPRTRDGDEWERIPDEFTIRRAIRHAVEMRRVQPCPE